MIRRRRVRVAAACSGALPCVGGVRSGAIRLSVPCRSEDEVTLTALTTLWGYRVSAWEDRNWLAFAVWILHGFFSSIPVEVEEAAQLDGSGRIRTLLKVMLPLTLPGLVTATIFTFIAAWNEYVVALTLMIDDDKKPLTVGFGAYVTGYEQHWDQLFAASVMAVVPVVILFALIEKHLVGGLTAGSVK